MFCPRCASQNTEEAKFCRACGADISLVPQAMTGAPAGRLAAEGGGLRSRRRRRERERESRPVTIERAVRSFFMGVAFLLVSLAVLSWAPAGRIWWFWMLIPAFAMLSDGVSTYLRLAEEKKKTAAPPFYTPPPTAVPHAPRASGLPPVNTGEIIAPPSVTEGTTRHLGVPVERARGEE